MGALTTRTFNCKALIINHPRNYNYRLLTDLMTKSYVLRPFCYPIPSFTSEFWDRTVFKDHLSYLSSHGVLKKNSGCNIYFFTLCIRTFLLIYYCPVIRICKHSTFFKFFTGLVISFVSQCNG